MDNLTHTLCGAALAKTRLGRMSRLAPAALILGANLPDVDLVTRFFGGKTSYLVHHRGITHSLLGVAALGVLLAAVVRAVERRTFEWEAPRKWSAYLLPALAGLFSHPALDFLNNYGVRPWLPFSSARYFGDLAFIVDPWLWLVFGGAAALAGARTPGGHLAWTAVAAFGLWMVLTHERAPEHVKAALPAAVLAIAAARALGVGRRRPRAVLACGALLLAGYLGLLAGSARIAVRNALARPPGPDSAWVAEDPAPQRFAMRSPTIADPFRWSLAIETDERVYWRRVGLDGRLTARGGTSARSLERNLDDPLVARAAKKPEAAPWRYFARLPWAWVETRPDGGAIVGLSDARYQFAQGPDWCSVEVELDPADVDQVRATFR